MANYQLIKDKLYKLLDKVKVNLSERDVAFIREEIDCGEEYLALEVLCEQLSEYKASITTEIYCDFQEIGEMIGFEQKYLSYVKELIVNNI